MQASAASKRTATLSLSSSGSSRSSRPRALSAPHRVERLADDLVADVHVLRVADAVEELRRILAFAELLEPRDEFVVRQASRSAGRMAASAAPARAERVHRGFSSQPSTPTRKQSPIRRRPRRACPSPRREHPGCRLRTGAAPRRPACGRRSPPRSVAFFAIFAVRSGEGLTFSEGPDRKASGHSE